MSAILKATFIIILIFLNSSHQLEKCWNTSEIIHTTLILTKQIIKILNKSLSNTFFIAAKYKHVWLALKPRQVSLQADFAYKDSPLDSSSYWSILNGL